MIQLASSTENLREGNLAERAKVFSDLGIRFVEVIGRGPKDPIDLAVAESDDIREPLRRRGIEPVALYTACLDIRDEEKHRTSVDTIVRAADLASALGCRRLVMTPFGPGVRDGYDYAKLAEGCAEVAERIGGRDVTLCLENHPGWPLTYSEDYKKIFALVDAPQLGITMDIAHFVRLGEDPLRFAEQWSDRIRHVHLKDSDGEKTVWFGEGKAPIGELLDLLREKGYKGYASLELEIRGVERTPDNLKKAWDACQRLYFSD